MLKDIAAGQIQAVAVWHMDRLHRQPRELEDFMELADTHSIALATVSGETDLSTDNGRLVRQNHRARSPAPKSSASQHDRSVPHCNARSPVPPGPHAACSGSPKPTATAPACALLEAEAEVIRESYTAILAGRSLLGIARELNAAGVKSSRGGTWNGKTVRDMLLAPRNAGLRAYRGEIVGQGQWPAIVTEDIWRGAVAVLTDPARLRKPHGGWGRKRLLSGLVTCGKCAHRFGSTRHTANNKPIYVCRNCQGASRQVEALDNYVLSLVAERLSRPDATGLLVDHARADLAQLQDEATALRKRRDELAELFAAGDIDGSQLKTGTASFRSQLEAIEAQMFDASKSRVFAGVIGADDVRAALDAMPLDRQRAIVSTLLVVTVMPGQPSRGGLRVDLLPVQWLS